MPTSLIILIAALITALISGLFGMAGGMIFMGIIASFLGVSEAMVVHGAVQGLSNSYRAFLLRANIRWNILDFHAIGALPAVIGLAFIMFTPSKAIVYFGLPLILTSNLSGLPPAWIFIAVIPCVMLGTFTGTRLLHHLSDIQFKSYTKYLVTLLGCVYLWRGLSLTGLVL